MSSDSRRVFFTLLVACDLAAIDVPVVVREGGLGFGPPSVVHVFGENGA